MYISELSDVELDTIQEEFRRLKACHYLDHAGATLYSEKQLQSSYEHLTSDLFCNPHTSKLTEDLIDQVRFKVLSHFHTNYDDYAVVFLSGATQALKTLAETFQFNGGGFFHTRDNHTSVLGMRAVVQTDDIHCLDSVDNFNYCCTGNNLIVFPAQSNFCGLKYPIVTLVPELQKQNAFVCLDASSFCSTSDLNLTQCPADFVAVSFYKLFGYPTGLGALLVSKRGQKVLEKRYYGGGTVKIAMSGLNFHRKRDTFHERFEDGTIPFLSIISLLSGFQTVHRLIVENESNSMKRISRHVFNLAKYLRKEMDMLVYPNGTKVVKFYQNSGFLSSDVQGGIVNFNVLHPDGSYVGYSEIAHMSTIHNIYLRTGCFCNPGACQQHLQLSDAEVRRHFSSGHICGDNNDLVDGIPTGSVRVSFGYMSRKENADALLQMIKSCYLRKTTIDHPMKMTNKDELMSTANGYSRVILKQICVYPIKSCAPIKVTTKWPLCNTGLKYDRNWMIVQDNGMALTQKVSTKLCLIQPKINVNNNLLLLQYPEMTSIGIELNCEIDNRRLSASICQTKVCGDRIEGIDCGDDVAEWLQQVLGISGLRLINMAAKRTSKRNTNEISLANQSQFLLINSSSVRWLAEKVEEWNDACSWTDAQLEPVIDRFRGNIIVESSNELEEGDWKHIFIGDVKFKFEGMCTRCQMICIDQHTGERTTEPLRTIAREFKGKMKFGVYLTLENFSQFIDCNSDIVVEC